MIFGHVPLSAARPLIFVRRPAGATCTDIMTAMQSLYHNRIIFDKLLRFIVHFDRKNSDRSRQSVRFSRGAAERRKKRLTSRGGCALMQLYFKCDDGIMP